MSTRTILAIFAMGLTALGMSLAQSEESAYVNEKKCALPEYRQFDFWIGEWNVVNPTSGASEGASKIEGLYEGCGVRENWRDSELTGGSLNIYDATDHHWHQFWIDSSGARREFIGGMDNGKMVLIS